MNLSSHTGRWDARLWGALTVLCAVIFLDALDVSMVGVALPSIQADLGLSTSTLQWVVSGYVLGYGGLLLLGGRAADLLGRRRVFLTALGVFAVASLLGGLVDDGGLLIAARFVKGISAAFTAPAALSIITTTFAEGPARNRALSIFTASGASGFSLGLVLSGLLTEIGWRWTFLMPVPVAVIALVAALPLLPRHSGEQRATGGYDLAGAATITFGMLLLVFAVVRAPETGWGSVTTIGTLAAAVALLAVFVVIETRVRHPLVRFGILRSGPLVRANLGLVVLFGSYVAFQFVAMQYFQNLLGWSALHTALVFLPAGLIVAVTSTKMGDLADRFGTARLIVIGSASLAAGYGVFLFAGPAPSLGLLLPGMALIGVSFALTFPSLNIQATAGVADDEQGLASGLLNTSGQVGGALILAVVTAVATAGGGAVTMAAIRPSFALCAAVALAGLGIAVTGVLRARTTAATPVPEPVREVVEAV
ncbi:MFS transporter [Sphaerisporangium rubeum]|uniref:MFS family permease n=1 Tax=Sphaerisporangium rubeum TaxID=321317 RepID=A0A7X0IB30_9ACTN|nr:MFS transporter [Sphaerisporangium rubeum]MBB6471944.1 MFS family permease [Sphaerisporangium rubeum]